MIIGICTTNLDDYKLESWPKMFCRVPNIGERVEAASGETLKVVGITHKEIKDLKTGRQEPFVIIELSKYW